MRSAKLLLVPFTLLLVALSFAAAASILEVPSSWFSVDTGGKDAIVLEFAKDGQPVSKALVREGELASIRLSANSQAIAVVVETIAERGDAARLGIYRLENQFVIQRPRASDWIEDVELVKGAEPVTPGETASYAGDSTFALRLVDTMLVTR